MLNLKVVLLLGAILATGVSAAIAELSRTQPAARTDRDDDSARAASHFLADYDLNHDGKIPRDELNRALGQRFAAVAHGQPINAQQFAADALKRYREREVELFRRADWNGDGKLTLDEFMAPLRARFFYADRRSTGVYDCSRQGRSPSATQPKNEVGVARRHGLSSRGICFTSDLNQDGKVTHAEYDAANTKRFAEAAHGAKTLTFDQFAGIGGNRFRQVGTRIFQSLDANNDGRLTIVEYSAAQQRRFAAIDRNKDGIVTRDELAVRGGGGPRSSSRFSARR
jgi:Ca2+-binding EF-hand superfamily protein